jgi:hypothetical protein
MVTVTRGDVVLCDLKFVVRFCLRMWLLRQVSEA